MNRTKYIVEVLLFVCLTCAFLARPVYAYLDPGSGSFILQVLLASFVGALFLIKQFWRRIWASVMKFGKQMEDPGIQDNEGEDGRQ